MGKMHAVFVVVVVVFPFVCEWGKRRKREINMLE